MTKKPEIQIPNAVKENPRSFIQIPQCDTVIAIEQTHNGKDMYQQLEGLAKESLEMPSPLYFMTHRNNTLEASQGRRQLVYADGTEVSRKIARDLWTRLSLPPQSVTNIRLNALFIKEEKEEYESPWEHSASTNWYIETDLRIVEVDGKKLLKGTRDFLDGSTLHEDGYAELTLNSQGFPTRKSPSQTYASEQNIIFHYPRSKTDAGFSADFDVAVLYCFGSPTVIISSLGTLASARGASQIEKMFRGKIK